MPTAKQLREAWTVLAAFDWSKVDALTDEEIIAAAKADPDTYLPTEEELKEFRRVPDAGSRPPKQAAE